MFNTPYLLTRTLNGKNTVTGRLFLCGVEVVEGGWCGSEHSGKSSAWAKAVARAAVRQEVGKEVRHELSGQEVRQELQEAAVWQEQPGQEEMRHKLPGQEVRVQEVRHEL